MGAARTERTAVFAYGSLVDPRSAGQTLGREVGERVPAVLGGWRRRFSQARRNRECEKTFARVDDGTVPEVILGLNVEPAPGEGGPNGVLIEVDDALLDRLDQREIRYLREDVTGAVAGAHPFDRVITYIARPENLATEPPPGAVILRSYAEAVEAAFAAVGPGALERYRETTLPYPTEVVEGRLVRDRIPEGNPRDW